MTRLSPYRECWFCGEKITEDEDFRRDVDGKILCLECADDLILPDLTEDADYREPPRYSIPRVAARTEPED